ANSQMTLPTALGASCDTYFYELGYRFYKLPAVRRHPFQEWASRFGFGRNTGIDLPGELPGLLPTPEWRKAAYTAKTDPKEWRVDRLWKPGDSIQLAIGQKDLLVTPLQMARFYPLVAHGGRPRPPPIPPRAQEGGPSPPPAPPRRRRQRSESTRSTSTRSARGSTRPRTPPTALRRRSSEPSRSRSRARRAPRRRTSAFLGSPERWTSPGGVGTGPPRRRRSLSAP